MSDEDRPDCPPAEAPRESLGGLVRQVVHQEAPPTSASLVDLGTAQGAAHAASLDSQRAAREDLDPQLQRLWNDADAGGPGWDRRLMLWALKSALVERAHRRTLEVGAQVTAQGIAYEDNQTQNWGWRKRAGTTAGIAAVLVAGLVLVFVWDRGADKAPKPEDVEAFAQALRSKPEEVAESTAAPAPPAEFSAPEVSEPIP